MRWCGLFFSCFLVFGCSAVVSPDGDRLGGGGGGGDTGTGEDTGPPIVLMDGGSDAMTTMPPPPDATVIDTAPGCEDSDPRCEGEILVRCSDGMVVTTDCAARGDYCDVDECRDQECDPGTSRCVGDGARVAICDDRGASETRMDCPSGCDPDSGTCRPMPMMCPGIPPLAAGASVMVNTCGMGDDETHTPTGDGGGCPTGMARANGDDIVYAITITSPQTITIDLRDDEEGVAIDTIVYLRRVCDEGSSQIACSDDLPCAATDFGCSGSGSGVEVRQSRITLTLEPGTYYVVVDTFNYETRTTRFACGDVLLRYTVSALTPSP